MTYATLPDLTSRREALVGSEGVGLTEEEARLRLAQFGPNSLPEPRASSLAITFVRQFRSPLIYILLAAALVSLLLSDLQDALFIGIVLIANGIIGSLQEHTATKAALALRRLEQPYANVIRDGRLREIDARLLVPGDRVAIEAGGRVPADIRLLWATDLVCDESLLTGESAPVHKSGPVQAAPGEGERPMAFAGTLVTRGRGRGVVVATGATTEMGKIAAEIGKASFAKPPLMIRLERFSQLIAWIVAAAIALLVLVGIARAMTLNELFMMSVGLAVSAIPEGLPIAISVALAISMRRMAKAHVIVRRMPAVEALGSCTMIATDKTGTLTLNELTVTDIRLPDGTDIVCDTGADLDACTIRGDGTPPAEARKRAIALLKAASLPNEGSLVKEANGWTAVGDTVDVALLAAAHKAGLPREAIEDDYPLVARIPYEPDLKYAASFHRHADSIRIFVKGAAETLIDMADRMDMAGRAEPIDRELLLRQKVEMAARGLRVLAFAEGETAIEADGGFGRHLLVDLVFLGLAGMQDPVRPEVPQAIRDCHTAGVDVAMVTGDDPRTAAAIASEAGLIFTDNQVVTGEEVRRAEEKGQESLDGLTRDGRIYARVAPSQKLAIVLSLARNGHFVAVTGDGVNDAPALKHAHIGVAMGRKGTEVAKESADIVITDDNFASIVSGIREGRVAYANIRKVIFMLMSTGAAELLLFLLAIPLGMPMPLLPVQLLWLNLVTNGIQDIALASENPEGDELSRAPRRPSEPIFDRLMIRRIWQSTLVMGAGGFAMFYVLLKQGYGETEARNLLLLLFVLFENFQTLTSRSERKSIFALGFLANPLLLASIVAAQALHIAAMYTPWLREVLRLSPISLLEWAMLLLAASSIFFVMEFDKWRVRSRPADMRAS
ncbi:MULTISPECIES: cation-translocating P-type ATPase [Sinorhizobium]|uniref:HAD-IC family P-type ATPase n=3 Tax=Sinorhizobium TaxID=28105 RepID=A0A844A500_RHIFR|nr:MULTISPECIES: HAD-IC family P-type ATPase [Sinorhizobium]AFL54850.1 putative cation-transporting ATPase F [Sinorhizobium fredii USDA 257]KSV90039.1 HAD family hydrolase [Sinorhizobium fredii USDA 205]MQX08053.1 HAD-IC family P-type ATPase [Sinorhizobium fredii]OAP35609.1 HAD family hydrolase [Sinorhizobium glycinis]CCE99134.1 K01537 Ca2+-transporting ATPase [Sinorhizobium fredii HH103]